MLADLRFAAPDLTHALGQTTLGWSDPSSNDAVHHAYSRVNLVINGMSAGQAGPWAFVLEQFAPIHLAFISRLGPGGYIQPHVDKGPFRERWQIPVHPAGRFRLGARIITPQVGVPFRVEHWHEHEVRNDTDHDRVHLVIDRDVMIRHDVDAFELRGPSQLADQVISGAYI